jgi:hypothetical protein
MKPFTTIKKLSFSLAAMLMMFASCQKYNERNFPDLKEYRPENELQLEYTLTDADYGAGNPLFFSPIRPAADHIPEVLKNRFPGLSPQSRVLVHYRYLYDIPTSVQNFHNNIVYRLTEADYRAIYGVHYSELNINGFSVLMPPENVLPNFLLTKFPNAHARTSIIVEYGFFTDVIVRPVFEEDFESNPDGNTNQSIINIPGWVNHDLGNLNAKWSSRAYGGNAYTQFTVFSPNPGDSVNSWLITPEIDLTGTEHPQVLFNLQTGFFVHPNLSVYVSSNFNGDTLGITSATWNDISSKLNLPTTGNTGGWSNIWQTTTPVDLTDYIGQKIRIALVYKGSGIAELTTRYQIDNLIIRDVPDQQPYNVVRNAGAWAHNRQHRTWEPSPAATTITVQPQDYIDMGLTAIATDQAHNFLPAFLNLNLPYALNGRVMTVVYKQPGTPMTAHADQYVKQNDVWSPVAVEQDKADQFVKLDDGSWVFDPTVVYTMTTPDYQRMVTYVSLQPDKSQFLRRFVGAATVHEPNNPPYEFWFGFGTQFANPDVTFQLTVRNQPGQTFDPELANAPNDAARVEIMHERLKDGMRIFCALRWPDATQFLDNIPNGVQMYYKVRVNIHRPGGDNNSGRAVYEYKFKVTGRGRFEFDSLTVL